MARTVPFTPIDEAVYNLERKSMPWNVQFEVASTASTDVETLREAARAAAATHPLARARRRHHHGWDSQYRWAIPDEVGEVPVRTVAVDEEADLAAARTDFFGEPFDLTEPAPPFRLLVARGAGADGGDRLLLCHSHVAADGVGGLRLLRSICSAYRGEDLERAVDLETAHAALEDRRPSSLAGRLNRVGEAAGHLRNAVEPPSRIAPAEGADESGWGFLTRRVPDDLASRLVEDRPEGVSVNDVLLAALHLAIGRWNADRGDPADKISLMMPVNLRPSEWRYDAVGMYALFESVTTRADDRRDPDATVERVAEQTAELKEPERAAAFLESLELIPAGTPVGLKQQLPAFLRGPGEGLLDTAMLSNLGRVPEPLPALEGTEPGSVWFSPPAWRPTPLGVGVVTVGETIHLCFRYVRSTFDGEAAVAFANLYLDRLAAVA